MGPEKAGPILFNGVCVDSLRVDAKIDESLLHCNSTVLHLFRILTEESGDKIAISLCFF